MFTIAALACLVGPRVGQTQVLVTAQYKCQPEKLGDVRSFNDSIWIPLAQEMVDEGKLIDASTAYHLWGDEWNVVYWYTGADIPAVLDAFSEMSTRVPEEARERSRQIAGWCQEHKDNMYARGRVTGPARSRRE